MSKPQDPPYALHTDRLLLRCWQPEDAEALFATFEVAREYLRPWMPWTLDDRAEARARCRQFRAEMDRMEDFKLAVFRREDGVLVGGTGIHRAEWTVRRFELGMWLRPDHTGHGYAQECIAGLTRFCFERWGARRVEVRIDPRNAPSRAVAERLGFVLEGVLRRNYAVGDTITDTCVYALVDGDWERLAPGWEGTCNPVAPSSPTL